MVVMVEDEGGLYQQLHKLSSCLKSRSTGEEEEEEEEAEVLVIEHMILSLWKSRKTGLSCAEKSSFQSLLGLPSLSHLDPVLACLRSLMRKFVHENMKGDDLLKLFPPDLPIDLQSILILLFQKHQPQWKLDYFQHHPSSSDISQVQPPLPLWRRHNHPVINNCFLGGDDANIVVNGHNGIGASSAPGPVVLIAAHSSNMSLQPPPPPPHDHDQGMLPRLKSMTWSMDKGKSVPANKVAVITLKLQDYTNSTSGEMEVKFRLTRETLEAMLRSMTYISEQLSNIVGSSSGPVQKKQRQSDHIV